MKSGKNRTSKLSSPFCTDNYHKLQIKNIALRVIQYPFLSFRSKI